MRQLVKGGEHPVVTLVVSYVQSSGAVVDLSDLDGLALLNICLKGVQQTRAGENELPGHKISFELSPADSNQLLAESSERVLNG